MYFNNYYRPVQPMGIIHPIIPRPIIFNTNMLNVTAISEDTIAAPGNRYPNYIIVSVTNNNGEPVTGLIASNFKVDPIIVAPGGALVDITSVSQQSLSGFYLIKVVPIRTETWKSGVYVFGIAVNSGAYKGQTLTSVRMD